MVVPTMLGVARSFFVRAKRCRTARRSMLEGCTRTTHGQSKARRQAGSQWMAFGAIAAVDVLLLMAKALATRVVPRKGEASGDGRNGGRRAFAGARGTIQLRTYLENVLSSGGQGTGRVLMSMRAWCERVRRYEGTSSLCCALWLGR
ncbi:hypothetical protein CC80DRAFT_219961 [Byssothecium circinans]|uniref:Uncharacterized protein n=1 Tax=Byssothecium circinans TaxID=147558 RepID=A0A6A5TDR5_9PLEO|nr:hypothetical protein CC80DRAFT_219961 [Byssothecium circinans]